MFHATRLRPSRLARYNATSAALINCSKLPSTSMVPPTLVVMAMARPWNAAGFHHHGFAHAFGHGGRLREADRGQYQYELLAAVARDQVLRRDRCRGSPRRNG